MNLRRIISDIIFLKNYKRDFGDSDCEYITGFEIKSEENKKPVLRTQYHKG